MLTISETHTVIFFNDDIEGSNQVWFVQLGTLAPESHRLVQRGRDWCKVLSSHPVGVQTTNFFSL